MFTNVDKKIQWIAQFWLYLGLFACTVTAISCMVFFFEGLANQTILYIGVGTLFGGNLLVLLSGWCLYGYGEIIKKERMASFQKEQKRCSRQVSDAVYRWKEEGLISFREYEEILHYPVAIEEKKIPEILLYTKSQLMQERKILTSKEQSIDELSIRFLQRRREIMDELRLALYR